MTRKRKQKKRREKYRKTKKRNKMNEKWKTAQHATHIGTYYTCANIISNDREKIEFDTAYIHTRTHTFHKGSSHNNSIRASGREEKKYSYRKKIESKNTNDAGSPYSPLYIIYIICTYCIKMCVPMNDTYNT